MRNTMTSLLFVSLLGCFSAAASAATELRSDDGHSSVGQISVTGASTVDDAVRALAKKADALGVPYFKTTAMGGKNKLFATAELLK